MLPTVISRFEGIPYFYGEEYVSGVPVRSCSEGPMAICRLLEGSPLEPEMIRSLEAAYEKTLRIIGLVDRDDPITEMIARKIIEIAQTGVHDPAELSAIAIKEIGIP